MSSNSSCRDTWCSVRARPGPGSGSTATWSSQERPCSRHSGVISPQPRLAAIIAMTTSLVSISRNGGAVTLQRRRWRSIMAPKCERPLKRMNGAAWATWRRSMRANSSARAAGTTSAKGSVRIARRASPSTSSSASVVTMMSTWRFSSACACP